MDDDNWDLQAVVRSCRFTGPAATTDLFSSFPPPSGLKLEEAGPVDGIEGCGGTGLPLCFPDTLESRSLLQELEELCKPFFPKTQQQPQQSGPSSPPSSATLAPTGAASLVPAGGPPQRQHSKQPHRPFSQIPRSKRRKNQQKRVVCHVPADGLSSDMWAWRKYGQKPIKGSPYPRGYYRCSSSKGCLARKQVERSRTDPAMFVITYTAEHNHPLPTHRNSLAGSTRHKFPPAPSSSAATPPPAASGGAGDGEHLAPVHPSSSPPSSSTAAGLSPTTPLTASMEDELLRRDRRPRKGQEGDEVDDDEEEEEEEEEMLLVEDMEVMGEDGLLFMGLDELSGAPATSAASSTAATEALAFTFFDDDDAFGEHFFPPPWLSNSNNNAAAAAGGG